MNTLGYLAVALPNSDPRRVGKCIEVRLDAEYVYSGNMLVIGKEMFRISDVYSRSGKQPIILLGIGTPSSAQVRYFKDLEEAGWADLDEELTAIFLQ